MIYSIGESSHVKAVRNLILKIQNASPLKDSLYEQAGDYFQQKVTPIQKSQSVREPLQTPSSCKKQPVLLQKNVTNAEAALEQHRTDQKGRCLERYNSLKLVCESILDLSEGNSFEETNRKSAKLLCSIQLLSPTDSSRVAHFHARAKHLYKAVLCLRLLDRMLLDNNITNAYALDVVKSGNGAISLGTSQVRQSLQIPFLVAALLQDVGHYHPEAQQTLLGERGDKDPFRVLNPEQRSQLLKISYKQSLNYLCDGIGLGVYIGNSRLERDEFNIAEKKKHQFIQSLLKNWLNLQHCIGNLLKITQIYTSVIMSTKPNYDYKLLPRAYDLLHQKADEGFYNKVTVDALLQITGKFPQGYGIAYIPKDSEGRDLDRYEYAIVIALYPIDESVPVCRMATKSHIFVSHDIIIKLAPKVICISLVPERN